MKTQCNLLLLAVLLIISARVNAQQMDTLRRKDANGWDFIQIRSYNVVMAEGYLQKGVKEGIWTEFWPNGFPKNTITYVHNKKDGMSMAISGIGRVEMLENYKNDMLEGPKRVFNKNGNGMLEETYYSEGKKHGKYTIWYPNSKIQETGVYSYDKRNGKATWYYEDGTMAAEYTYVDGQMEGDAATYYANGKVESYGVYKNGKQSGPWKEYYDNGMLKSQGMYKDGEKDGDWDSYSNLGKQQKTNHYVKGEIK